MKIKIIPNKEIQDVYPDACKILFRPTTDEEKKALEFLSNYGECFCDRDEESDLYILEAL